MVAYLQGEEHEIGCEELAVLKDVETQELVYYYMDGEEATLHREIMGECNWIAQTTDPMMAAYMSIAGRYNQKPVEGCKILQKSLLRYLKGQLDTCLVSTVRYTATVGHSRIVRSHDRQNVPK